MKYKLKPLSYVFIKRNVVEINKYNIARWNIILKMTNGDVAEAIC